MERVANGGLKKLGSLFKLKKKSGILLKKMSTGIKDRTIKRDEKLNKGREYRKSWERGNGFEG